MFKRKVKLPGDKSCRCGSCRVNSYVEPDKRNANKFNAQRARMCFANRDPRILR